MPIQVILQHCYFRCTHHVDVKAYLVLPQQPYVQPGAKAAAPVLMDAREWLHSCMFHARFLHGPSRIAAQLKERAWRTSCRTAGTPLAGVPAAGS